VEGKEKSKIDIHRCKKKKRKNVKAGGPGGQRTAQSTSGPKEHFGVILFCLGKNEKGWEGVEVGESLARKNGRPFPSVSETLGI